MYIKKDTDRFAICIQRCTLTVCKRKFEYKTQ